MAVLKWLIILVAQCLLHGVVLMLLWGWFIAPTFSLTVISLTQAIGIGTTISLLTVQYVPVEKENFTEMVLHGFFLPVVLLAIGWIAHFFM